MQQFVTLGWAAANNLLENHWDKIPDAAVRGDTYRPKALKRRRERKRREREARSKSRPREEREVDETDIDEIGPDGREYREVDRDEIEYDDYRPRRPRESRRDDFYLDDDRRRRERRERERDRDYDRDDYDSDRRDRRSRSDRRNDAFINEWRESQRDIPREELELDDGRSNRTSRRGHREAPYEDLPPASEYKLESRSPLAPSERYDGRSRIRSKSLMEESREYDTIVHTTEVRDERSERDIPRPSIEEVVREEEIIEAPIPPVEKADTVITERERRKTQPEWLARDDARSERSGAVRSRSVVPRGASSSASDLPYLPPPPIQAMERFKAHTERQLAEASQQEGAYTQRDGHDSQALMLPMRPRLVSRRSQSVDMYDRRPRNDRRRERRDSPDRRDGSRDRKDKERRHSIFTDSELGLGAGALGAVAGGILAQQAQIARAKSKKDANVYNDDEDEKLWLTALGAAVGGIGANVLVSRTESQRNRDRDRRKDKERRSDSRETDRRAESREKDRRGERREKVYRSRDGREVREYVVDRRGGRDEWIVDRRTMYYD